MHPEKVLGRFH